MKLSLDWINDYVDISDIDPNDIAQKLTITTAEVEAVIPVKRKLKHVMVGEVKALNIVLAGEGLKEIIVDSGIDKTRTLTTANDLKIGNKYAFAQLGAALNRRQYVQIKEIAGAESHGKLCTPGDLCLGECNDQLLQIPDSVPVGSLLSDFVPESDTLLDIDNHSLTHRPDLWGHYGFAREISAIFQRPLRPLKTWDNSVVTDLPKIEVENPNHSMCPLYHCIRLSNYRHQPSPLKVQSRLNTLGHKTYNLAVDLTNYVMLETAQPLHAFDGKRVKGIRVAESTDSQKTVTLDGIDREIAPKDLIIWNLQGEPLALAGIMGCRYSQVVPETQSLLLESACFKGSKIRQTANRLHVSSEASKRFEKRLPAAMAEVALKRMLHLLTKSQPDIVFDSGLTTVGKIASKPKEVIVPVTYFSSRMGVKLSKKEIKRHLKGLKFVVREKRNNLCIEVPWFRSEEDIAIPEDILEEVARMHGYDNVQPVLPVTAMKAVSRDSRLELERAIRGYLVRSGHFQEVQTYNWYDHEFPGFLPRDSKDLVKLVNPVSATNPWLRDAILPNLLEVMRLNADHCLENSIFEIGSVFHHNREFRVVSALNYSLQKQLDSESFTLSIKGILEGLFDDLNLQAPDFIPYSELTLGELEEYTALAVCVAGKKVGQIGMLKEEPHSRIVKDCQAVWFELELETVHALKRSGKKYTPIPKYPGSWFDFSILFPDGMSFRNLEKRLDGYKHSLLKRRQYLYKYKGEGIQDEMTSYTFRFTVGSDDRTLSNEDLEDLHNDLTGFFNKEGIQVR